MIINQTKKFDNVVDQSVRVPDSVSYIVHVPATTTVEVRITMEPHRAINSTFIPSGQVSVSFADTNPDTITRTQGSWIEEGFQADQALTIAGTASNDGSYTIASVTNDTITLVGGDTLAAETVTDFTGVSITATIPDTDWFVHQTVTGDNHLFEAIEYGPTGLRFVRTGGAGTVRVWVKG